jgi:hypothetical protein
MYVYTGTVYGLKYKVEATLIDFNIECGECTIIGGLTMEGKKEDDVTVKHLPICQSKRFGVCGNEGMSSIYLI